MTGCREELVRRRRAARILPSRGTPLGSGAEVFREMIDAYLADGDCFRDGNDLMNAAASYWYALGWMDAGSSLGLIGDSARAEEVDFLGGTPVNPEDPRVPEKAARYRMLLGNALESLQPAPERGSSLEPAAGMALEAAGGAHTQGLSLEARGRLAAAIGAYSYGFAWLDAGVRFGIFRITGQREPFTI